VFHIAQQTGFDANNARGDPLLSRPVPQIAEPFDELSRRVTSITCKLQFTIPGGGAPASPTAPSPTARRFPPASSGAA
jgi:hypothetical protein